ncbi:MAG: hypothetical protein CMC55_08610 [Flavobacteriaceae bacterium]|nr:hypothetical protein [Flavobacteriaceae bacterium]|tara:strand:- start:439 stop:645 length:207 start_codon:yes stop_codon:yes gene_type:complete
MFEFYYIVVLILLLFDICVLDTFDLADTKEKLKTLCVYLLWPISLIVLIWLILDFFFNLNQRIKDIIK